MAIRLLDDGTLDTLVQCDDCGEEFRGTWMGESPEDSYESFVASFISEVENEHICHSDAVA